MWQNPFTQAIEEVIDLRGVTLSEEGRGVLQPALEEEISFNIPEIKIDNSLLASVFKLQGDPEKSSWAVPRLIGSRLEEYSEDRHTIAWIRDRIDVLNGSELLTAAGFVDSPFELCGAVAERHALMLLIDRDSSQIRKMLRERKSYQINRETGSLMIASPGTGFREPDLVLSGRARDACFRRSTFLKVERFDRAAYQALLENTLKTLDELQSQAKSTFETFYRVYERVYDRFMYGDGDSD